MTERSYVRSLGLSPSQPEVAQGTPVDFAAHLAAETLGVDKSWAKDKFEAQVEAAGGLSALRIGSEQDITVGVTVGADDHAGEELTPLRVIKGHDALTNSGGGVASKTTKIYDGYDNRSSEWWNRRLPESEQGIQIVQDPLVILSLSGLRGAILSQLQRDTGDRYVSRWSGQEQALIALSRAESTERVATVGAAPLDWMMGDSGRVVLGRKNEAVERLDERTFTNFVQHKQESDDYDPGVALGPFAGIIDDDDDRAWLVWSDGGRRPYAGYRSVRGPRKQP